jgi:hypothetical protein
MDKAEYLIDGLQFQNFEEFIAHFNHVFFNGRPVWNGNLNAFNDILRGGFGQPEEGYTIKWIHSEEAQKNLHAVTLNPATTALSWPTHLALVWKEGLWAIGC